LALETLLITNENESVVIPANPFSIGDINYTILEVDNKR